MDTSWTGTPRSLDRNIDVAHYYDELDRSFVSDAQLHIHHGLWLRGTETRIEAKENLVTWIGDILELREGQRCLDIGSGYGATARSLATSRKVTVDAITSSTAQHKRALLYADDSSVNYHCGDWLRNSFPSGSFDAVWAVESAEHVSDLALFMREGFRVLRPGGTFLILTWLSSCRPHFWARTLLLEPIRSAGRLADLRSSNEVLRVLRDSGLTEIRTHDLTAVVRRTWPSAWVGSVGRIAAVLGWNHQSRIGQSEAGISCVTMRIGLAYDLGTMRYAAFLAQRPSV